MTQLTLLDNIAILQTSSSEDVLDLESAEEYWFNNCRR